MAEALAQYQADRKPVTDELQRISRSGWTEDEVNSVFPGQKPENQNPAEQQAADHDTADLDSSTK
ncbi:hypothetical protein [Kocuria atrinae]|uniref:hypothetical protein n=1 Tax=Kocuria atrinae TaxID=592377 RepID=UPI0002D5EEC0|nr:hypothetical protein [Kocuria atrinae]